MATEGVDRMRENDEFDKKHPGKRKEQVLALQKRKQEFAKKIGKKKETAWSKNVMSQFPIYGNTREARETIAEESLNKGKR